MIRLVLTSFACPEQYDAYDCDRQVGYLRLRNGVFYVECPTCPGQEVYSAMPAGDGRFEDHERDRYLRFAVAAIERWVRGEWKPEEVPNVDYVIEG